MIALLLKKISDWLPPAWRLVGLIALLGAGLFMSGGRATADNWSVFRHDSNRTAATSDFGPIGSGTVGTFDGNCIGAGRAWALVNDNRLYAYSANGSDDDHLCVFDADRSGRPPIGTVECFGSVNPIISGDRIYTACNRPDDPPWFTSVRMYDKANPFGASLWTTYTGMIEVTGQALGDGTLFVTGETFDSGYRDATLMAFRASDGGDLFSRVYDEPIWTTNISEPLYVNGQLYVTVAALTPTKQAQLFRLNPNDGSIIWQRDFGVAEGPGNHTYHNSPVYHDGVIYVAGEMIAAFTEDGTQLWQVPAEGTLVEGISYWNGKLYYNAFSGVGPSTVVALNASDGEVEWRYEELNAGIDPRTPVVSDNGIVYACGDKYTPGNALVALNANTGDEVWIRSDIDCISSPVIYRGVLYVSYNGSDGKIYAIGTGFSLPPLINSVNCSTDDGATFGSCNDLPYGATLTHVRANCTGRSSAIDQARFTITGPSGVVVENIPANEKNYNDYTLHAPVPMDKAGAWSVNATCVDNNGGSANLQDAWQVGAAGSSDPQKLTLYDGTARISDGDTLEIGNVIEDANVDLMSEGAIYFRPRATAAASFFEGVSAAGKQRLQLYSGGANGPALEAFGQGASGQPWLGPAVSAAFEGAGYNSGGSAVYGELLSCGAGRVCYAGYFANFGQPGSALSVTASDPNQPALAAKHTGGGAAGQFIGIVNSTGDLVADNNVPGSCVWQPLTAGVSCPTGKIVSGLRFNPANITSELACCSL